MTDAERKIVEAYQAVFASPQGQLVLEHMKRRAGVTWCRVSKVAPIEANRVIWNEAQREFVLGILKNVEFDWSKADEPSQESE